MSGDTTNSVQHVSGPHQIERQTPLSDRGSRRHKQASKGKDHKSSREDTRSAAREETGGPEEPTATQPEPGDEHAVDYYA